MNLKKWIQITLTNSMMVALMVTVAACSSHKRRDASAINEANAAYSDGAQASGVGEERNFGDTSGGSQGRSHIASKRTYYFDFDKYNVHEGDKPAIAANARTIAAQNKKVMVEGHTDPRGSREYNIGLGERRAKSVAEVLIAKGVHPSQVRVVSYGAEKLASTGHTESDYQQDRRGVLVHTN